MVIGVRYPYEVILDVIFIACDRRGAFPIRRGLHNLFESVERIIDIGGRITFSISYLCKIAVIVIAIDSGPMGLYEAFQPVVCIKGPAQCLDLNIFRIKDLLQFLFTFGV